MPFWLEFIRFFNSFDVTDLQDSLDVNHVELLLDCNRFEPSSSLATLPSSSETSPLLLMLLPAEAGLNYYPGILVIHWCAATFRSQVGVITQKT